MPLESDERSVAVKLQAGGRSQTVMVGYNEGDSGGGWIKVESGFALVCPEAAQVALDYLGRPENGGVGLGRLDDFLGIRWSVALDATTLGHVATMVDSVAGHSDRLDAYISGGQDTY